MSDEKKTVLIVEDNAAMLQSLTDAFEERSVGVLSAIDGASGFDLALKEKPVAIVLDVMMPNKDGLSMLKELRADAWGGKVPVIILTNLTYVEDMPEIKNLATEFLLKSETTVSAVVDSVYAHLGT